MKRFCKFFYRFLIKPIVKALIIILLITPIICFYTAVTVGYIEHQNQLEEEKQRQKILEALDQLEKELQKEYKRLHPEPLPKGIWKV